MGEPVTSAVIAGVVGKTSEQITEMTFKLMQRHIGYLFHYKRYIKTLEDEVEILGHIKTRVEEKVKSAEDNGQDIFDDVGKWVADVVQKENEVALFLEGRRRLTCLSVGLRYRLGRQGDQKTKEVAALKERGDRFDSGSVAHPARLSPIWDAHDREYQHFDSTDRTFKKVMEALRDDSCYTVGIHGMAGAGKTRMADEVAKQAQEDGIFEEVAKATLSQTPDWEKIQQDLADCLNLSLDRETSRAARAGRLHHRFKKGKKILVILDDVWDRFKLKEIGIPLGGDETKGCKILLTSRRAEVCSQMRVDKVFQIPLLSKDEAWSLFQKTVEHSIDNTSAEMHLVAKAVCEECAGLPLAILALGGALMNADRCEWDDILRQLRNSRGNHIDGIEGEVYASIELSYRYLKQPDAQSCFLYCSLFPEDAQISVDYLVKYGVGTRFLQNIDQMKNARDRVHALVGTLKRSSLLLQGQHENFVKMHDVVRDVAISIASKDKQYAFLVKNGVQRWPEKEEYKLCKAISIRSRKIDELPDDLKFCPELQTLVLECSNPSLNIPDSFFNGMEKLEVLDLFKMRISTLELSLPILIHLRVLCLHHCKLGKLAILKKLCYLEILSLQDSDVQELSTKVGNLSRLRVLDLRGCRKLKLIPAGFISCLSRLEELYIYEFDRWEVKGNASPLELNSLVGLTVLEIHLPNTTLLPGGILLGQLIRFKISMGCHFEKFNDYDNKNLKILKLNNIQLKDEPNNLMENAQSLYPKLEYLKVKKCSDMENLLGKPKGTSRAPFHSFSELRVLTVSNCELRYLFFPSTARGLKQLKELSIKKCETLEAIIGEDEEVVDNIIFSQLEHLELRNLQKLRSFSANVKMMSNSIERSPSMHAQPLFSAKFSFPLLRTLILDGLECIIAVNQLLLVGPEVRDSFPKLHELVIKNCEDMEMIVVVEMKGEGGGEDIENAMVVFPELETIKLEELPYLKSFCGGCASKNQEIGREALFKMYHKVKAPHFKKLHIQGLHSLKEIWHSTVPAGSVTELTELLVCNCDKLLSVAPSRLLRSVVHKLEWLAVVNCDSLQYVFQSEVSNAVEDEIVEKHKKLMTAGVENSSLSFLKLSCLNLPSFSCLQPFLKEKISFPMLEKLILSDGSMFEEIWEGRVPEGYFLGKVRALMLFNCSKLESVYGLLQKLEGVEELRLDSCSTLEAVFSLQGLDATERLAVERVSNRVKDLRLETLNRLEDIWRMEPGGGLGLPVVFSNLTDLCVQDCNRLRYVFTLSVARALPQLRYLSIKKCGAMQEIVEILENEEEDDKDHEIDFPQLMHLSLVNLRNLRSFCGANNVAFQFRSLHDVELHGCPRVSTFTHGPTTTPEFQIRFDVDWPEFVSDINRHVQQCAEERKKLTLLDNQDQQHGDELAPANQAGGTGTGDFE